MDVYTSGTERDGGPVTVQRDDRRLHPVRIKFGRMAMAYLSEQEATTLISGLLRAGVPLPAPGSARERLNAVAIPSTQGQVGRMTSAEDRLQNTPPAPRRLVPTVMRPYEVLLAALAAQGQVQEQVVTHRRPEPFVVTVELDEGEPRPDILNEGALTFTVEDTPEALEREALRLLDDAGDGPARRKRAAQRAAGIAMLKRKGRLAALKEATDNPQWA